MRTQLNLLAVGENPQEWGFALFDEKKLSRLVRSYRYTDWSAENKYWDIMDSVEDGKEYPYCNDLLHWFKDIGWREYLKRAERRQKARRLLLKALRVVKVWRYPHYAAEVLRRLGVIKS